MLCSWWICSPSKPGSSLLEESIVPCFSYELVTTAIHNANYNLVSQLFYFVLLDNCDCLIMLLSLQKLDVMSKILRQLGLHCWCPSRTASKSRDWVVRQENNSVRVQVRTSLSFVKDTLSHTEQLCDSTQLFRAAMMQNLMWWYNCEQGRIKTWDLRTQQMSSFGSAEKLILRNFFFTWQFCS